MRIFDELSDAEAEDWARWQMDRAIVETFAFVPVPEQIAITQRVLRSVEVPSQIDPRSGLVRFTATVHSDEGLPLGPAMYVAVGLDAEREWTNSNESEGEELPPSSVLLQSLSRLDGILSLGPGGRVTARRFGDRVTVDVTVRTRGRTLRSVWRDPSAVGDAVRTLVEEAPEDVRLRGAFGYTEPSRYEAGLLMRPVFVLLLDRPEARQGPRWRVEATIAATRIVDDDLPPGITVAPYGGACV